MPPYLGYWSVGTHFLSLASAACSELVNSNNAHFIISDAQSVSDYDEITKWSDHSIGIAVLFNFYHGVELILKGFIATQTPIPKTHKLTNLLYEFEKNYSGTPVACIIKKYTSNFDSTSPLGMFFLSNGISVDDWYQALKYPESVKQEQFNHINLKYGSLTTVDFWRNVGISADKLIAESVKLARQNGYV